MVPHSSPSLSSLSGRGFKLKRHSRLPGIKTLGESTPEEATEVLESGRSGVRVQKGKLKVDLHSTQAADSMALVLDSGEESVLSLSQMRPAQQTAVVKGLSGLSPKRQVANIQRMVKNTVLPSDLAGQIAQWSGTDKVTVDINREAQLNGRIPDAQELEALSEKAKDNGADPDYIINGCQTRGHLNCGILRDQGINSSKIFAKGKLKIPGAKLKQSDDGTVKEAAVGWKYHTAPLVMVENEAGKVEPKVWDGNLARATGAESEWFHPSDWLGSFESKGDLKISVESDKRYTPYDLITLPLSMTNRTAREDNKAFNAEAKEFHAKQHTLEQLLKE